MSDWSSHVFSSDIGDRVLDGRDLLGSIVGDFDAEFFLERHHQLDDVEAVRAEIVDEARVLGDLVGLDAEMLDADLLHAIGGLAHVPSPSLAWGLNCLNARRTRVPPWQVPDVRSSPCRRCRGASAR